MMNSPPSRATLLALTVLVGATLSSNAAIASRGQRRDPQQASRHRGVRSLGGRWNDVLHRHSCSGRQLDDRGLRPERGPLSRSRSIHERAVRPFATRLSKPARPVSTRVWADGDHVIVNWEGVGLARDGEACTNSYAWIFSHA
ncbi:conserved exported hypothetical protein [Mesorhizobium delmotii]|uniref:Uncharacterized protein n=1 Tax=Mesorhizobium delmotii TaxID=1631247 RepID=A0A2P9AW93_9HYPH|nr:conserved exported hypothetical protein [Mesorhizobium delmotii]